MLRAIKEHIEDMAVDLVLKRLVPSAVATGSAWLARELRTPDGHQFFRPASVKAILALSMIAAHGAVHIWEKLKLRAEVAEELKRKEGK